MEFETVRGRELNLQPGNILNFELPLQVAIGFAFVKKKKHLSGSGFHKRTCPDFNVYTNHYDAIFPGNGGDITQVAFFENPVKAPLAIKRSSYREEIKATNALANGTCKRGGGNEVASHRPFLLWNNFQEDPSRLLAFPSLANIWLLRDLSGEKNLSGARRPPDGAVTPPRQTLYTGCSRNPPSAPEMA